MSFATVRFFNNIFQMNRASGVVPVFSSNTTETAVAAGTDTTYPASFSWTGVKVRRDVGDQVLQLPVDATDITNFEKCNIAVIQLSDCNRWYWIADFREITNSAYPNSTTNRLMYEVTLEYIPITTTITLSQSIVTMLPERKPTATARVMQNWTQSIMKKTTATTPIPDLPKLPKVKHWGGAGNADQTMWCEVNYTDSGTLKKLGFFIFSVGNGSSTLGSNVQYDSFSISGSTYHYPLYPSLIEVMEDPNSCLNIAAANILSITISEFCPYSTIVRTTPSTEPVLRIGSGSEIAATYTTSKTQTISLITYSYDFYVYDLTNAIMIKDNNSFPSSATTITVSLTDFEKMNGQLVLRDSMKNKVSAIPREMNASSMSVSVKTYSDLNNIYTVLKFEDMTMTLPGYMVPWTTSGWDTYRAFNLEYDRQALQNNINMANTELLTSTAASAAAGAVGGSMIAPGPGSVAGALIGGAAGLASYGLGIYAKNQQQELTEQRMKASPTTINNPAYGYGVCEYVDAYGGAELYLEMPADFTSTQWGYQTDAWGYPSNKVQISSVLAEGYWKGRILQVSSTWNNTSQGPYFDALVQQMDNGVRLKKVK